MRDRLPLSGPLHTECAVLNLDNSTGMGTHWVAYYKINSVAYYFDSYGNLAPPIELIQYLGSDINIFYNYMNYQQYGTVICGQLCILFLLNVNKYFFMK